MSQKSFMETQFPVSKLSKESYKERKANNSQTLTGLGKWWGRKPLVLVRAVVIGLLMPASDDPKADREIFLKIMTMDDEGLWRRRRGNLTAADVMPYATPTEREQHFAQRGGKWAWHPDIGPGDRERMQRRAFNRMSYDARLKHCVRPEEIEGPSEDAWREINAHLGTSASSLTELVQQLGVKRFGRIPRVGDAFCGGGSVPFEAARLGCEAYGSDLSPVAALLTWASLNIIGGGPEAADRVRKAQQEIYDTVRRQVDEWGIERCDEGWADPDTGETVGKGWTADYYLYCSEAVDPMTGWRVPLAPSWAIGEKTHTIARLIPRPASKSFDIEIHQGVSNEELAQAKAEGTWSDGLRCPVDREGNWIPHNMRQSVPADQLRGRNGCRLWENEDIVPRPEDAFQERLYCIRWIDPETGDKRYRAPSVEDLERERLVLALLRERFADWQAKGYLPSRTIQGGYNTDQPIRERGYAFWHQLFTPRQLLVNGLFNLLSRQVADLTAGVGCTLAVTRLADWNCKLSRWCPDAANEKGQQVFFNQALNTLANYANRGSRALSTSWFIDIPDSAECTPSIAEPADARTVSYVADAWITDPPYADAVNYEELSEHFIAWIAGGLPRLFPDWYSDSRRALAVKGSDTSFKEAMVDCYARLNECMPDDGYQVVMFTHQDAEVWSDLALILWAAGLQVVTAWTLVTETDTVLRAGKYVQGTVLMVLRKQASDRTGDMADVYPEMQQEVQTQIRAMLDLDDREDPNFGDSDYQLAAYMAVLRVVTSYRSIDDIDVARELRRERKKGEESPLTSLIRSAVKIASDYLMPDGLDSQIWRTMSPEERFYLKGIEVESHGEYRDGVYQEFARGFGLKDYRGLLGSGEANRTRLKTPSEMKGRDLSGGGFAGSLLRHVLFAIYKTSEDQDPQPGYDWLRQELPSYWDSRTTIIALLRYLHTKPSESMTEWAADREAAFMLLGRIESAGA